MLVILAAAGIPGTVRAETSATFEVSATIAAGCSVDGVGTSGNAGSIGLLDFGHDTTLSTATHATSLAASQAITLRCTPGVSLLMRIDGGQHAVAGVRHLQKGASTADRLQYRLYRNAGMTSGIDAGVDQSIMVSSADMNDVKLPVYAQLSLPGGSAAGTYADTLLVTLSW